MANKSYCSITDKYYTDDTVKTNLSKAYKEHYMFEPLGKCEGCGAPATCTAHIIAKARLKVLHLTSLIWNPEVWFRSCYRCNTTAENPSSEDIKHLLNFDRILEVTSKYDVERFNLMNE
jgi:5-methylcytosine-specific restriction endonuclease McrA